MSAPYAPDYASYNWTGAPSNFSLATDPVLGGDSRFENLNKWFQSGDQAYIIIASAMVMVMIPGLAFLYSGLARRKSALSLIWACMGSMSVVFFQWYFWGYSLAFSPTATNGFIGNLRNFGLMKTLADPSPGSALIPGLLFAFYQMQFCAVTAAIIMGAVAERGRLLPAMVFVFFWATIVYCPVTCWVWNSNGWAAKYGVMDYAGGGPVEIVSGMSGLAYSMVLGRRHEHMMLNFRPHNVSLIVLGTVLLWFGWLGFNGGSAFGANLRAVIACWNSNLTAAFASITWVLLDSRLSGKWTMVGWCSGTISGLVAATPASGFIPLWASVILGVVTGLVSNYCTKIKFWLKIDDSMDIFAEHGVAGIIGLIFNALFGDDAIVGLDGVNVGAINPETHTHVGGWIIHNYRQLYIQLAYIVACMGYAFVVSALLAYAINYIPGLHLRASEEAELLGMDDDQLGEFAYDYVEVRRDHLAWTPQTMQPCDHTHQVPRPDLYGSQAHSAMAARPVQNGKISPDRSTDNIPGESPSDTQATSGPTIRNPSPERKHRLARVFGMKRVPAPSIPLHHVPITPTAPPAHTLETSTHSAPAHELPLPPMTQTTPSHSVTPHATTAIPSPPPSTHSHHTEQDDLNEKSG
uniref:Ammonium transporter n=1 Tax=Coccidioides posadasii RMSCC 3488 TaxID=454284 RepID=A0A0J6F8B0_COCPO|nr:ammonium transporter MeaA [Coccidioides posadasii RMSCC 3488]